ncbi:response regulator with CheY-like receiver domain and winged-helix DNA-binding domain [Burkholderiales bacterium JOSHI_001]|nr:response regulator with CheY-like receiver domain and winged-helix DNA-binding domain [Burkholderiales bacterium JOSHI_001]
MPRIALIGFRPFERNALGSYLRLMGQRRPAYQPTEEADAADWLVVDADQPGFVDQVLNSGRLARAVFVGRQAPEGAAAWLQRPIDPQHLLRELDVLVALQGQPVTVPTRPAPLDEPGPPALNLVDQPRPWAGAAPPVPPPKTAAPAASAPAVARGGAPLAQGELLLSDPVAAFSLPALPAGLPSIALGAPGPVKTAPEVLLLDASEATLRFLEKQADSAGLVAHRARSARDALALLARREFSLLVLECESGDGGDGGDGGEFDGLTLCQHIKRNHVHLGENPPRVVLVTARLDPVQRVRAQLAGCDEFLTKPLQENELQRVLRRVAPAARHSIAG